MPNESPPISPSAAREIQQALDRQRSLPASFRGLSRAALRRAAGLLRAGPGPFDESVEVQVPGGFGPEEAIVRLYDRPSLLVQNDRITVPESDTWRTRLSIFRPVIEPRLRSVGRLELRNSDDFEWVGTAWMIGPDLAITNRHVALTFTDFADGGGYKARRGYFAKADVAARIDFAEESGVERVSEIEIKKVLYVSPTGDASPDLAILQVEPSGSLPAPIELGDDPKADDWVGLVGYPARDSRNGADAQARIFGELFDVKRFAPGKVMAGDGGFVFSHDASTLGGNSGSVVLSLATGKAVGLHFGGRFMQANFAVKVSKIKEVLLEQKIQVAVPPLPPPEKKLAFGGEESIEEAPRGDPTHKPAYFAGRTGYDEAFLGEGFEVPWPDMRAWKGDLVPVLGAGAEEHRLDYTHFSVVLCKSRRMALVTAVNVDGASWQSIARGSADNTWYLDGRVDRAHQLGNLDAYDHNKLDKGHQVRREDPNWGPDAATGNTDTFHYTNSCPQHKDLNQKTWLELESYLLDTAKAKGLKMTVFTGPVLREDDFAYREIQVPAEFFKIAVVVDAQTGKLEATGYLQSQTDYLGDIDEEVFNGGSTYQVPIAHLEKITQLDFGALRGADPMRGTDESRGFPGRRIRRPEDIRHR
jgi:endonuclease G